MPAYIGPSVFVAWSMIQRDAKVFRNRIFRGNQFAALNLGEFATVCEGATPGKGLFCGAVLNVTQGRYLLDDELLSLTPVAEGYKKANQFTGLITASVAGQTQFNRNFHASNTFSFSGLKAATTESQVREFLIAHSKLKNAAGVIVAPAAENISFGVVGRDKF